MFDLILYAAKSKDPRIITFGKQCFELLEEGGFNKIGTSETRLVKELEDEMAEVNVIVLTPEIRTQFIELLGKLLASKSIEMSKIGKEDEVKKAVALMVLGRLYEILVHIADPDYQFLDRDD